LEGVAPLIIKKCARGIYMEYSGPPIRTTIARIITDKPVRKTPYQVKGVFMRQYSDLEIVPMMDGTYRNRFLYPRVQIKILNEQI
jgi:hypothetical protein